jgi:N-formylglutamate deformylase
MNTASPRVASGLGTIPRTVGDGVSIYRGTLTLAEALTRIETLYRPYHRALSALLDEAVHATGQVLLVDCHSMPASAVRHLRGHRSAEPDVVIGDRFGSACSPHLIGLIEEHFAASGLVVSRNKPYAGGFITETHGRPRENRHAVQIEVNRALYMDERSRKPHAGFDTLKSLLDGLAVKLAETLSLAMGQPMAPTLPAKAAE